MNTNEITDHSLLKAHGFMNTNEITDHSLLKAHGFMNTNEITDHSLLRQYTSPQIITLDPISLGFLVYIHVDAVCGL